MENKVKGKIKSKINLKVLRCAQDDNLTTKSRSKTITKAKSKTNSKPFCSGCYVGLHFLPVTG
jgi:hypothetical protein